MISYDRPLSDFEPDEGPEWADCHGCGEVVRSEEAEGRTIAGGRWCLYCPVCIAEMEKEEGEE